MSFKSTKHTKHALSALTLAVGLAIALPAAAQTRSVSPPNTQPQSTTAQSVQPRVDDRVADAATAQRAKLIEDASFALDKTQEALGLLDQRKNKQALGALEAATGKLELVLARDPKLALAPVDVRVIIHDYYATPDAVRKAVKEARKRLGDGEVQQARPMVATLASEIVIETDNLPMSSYPAAIKSAARLIDMGRPEEAKAVLVKALSTIVVTQKAIPLPVIRAEEALKEAEKLAENAQRDAQQNQRLSQLLAEVSTQIELAQALGYGKKSDFKPILDQIKTLEQRTAGGKSGTGWFDDIKARLAKLF